MTGDTHNVFLSYAHADRKRVKFVTDFIEAELKLRALPISLWTPDDSLAPGANWDEVLSDVLSNALGAVVFVSHRWLDSNYAYKEFELARSNPSQFVLPILLDDIDTAQVPQELAQIQWVRVSDANLHQNQTKEGLSQAQTEILWRVAEIAAESIESHLERMPSPIETDTSEVVNEIASGIANDLRSTVYDDTLDTEADDAASVFLVHGHHTGALSELSEFLTDIGVEPVILARQERTNQNLLQHFMAVAGRAKFAVVLVSSDDFGASAEQYQSEVRGEPVAERALQYRARQNVILELGFFYGRLGFENVFVVFKESADPFPNFEWPSDLGGFLWDNMSDPEWKANLTAKLRTAGLIT